MKTILIAGGTGLVGQKLRLLLEKKGHTVKILTRTPREKNQYRWNPQKLEIDKEACKNVSILINLCGENVADKRWTKHRKKLLFDSRIGTTQLLESYASEMSSLECYISASGINSYGFENDEKVYTESDPFGSDYMSQLVKDWEIAADLFSRHCRVVKMRISVVLDRNGGALKKMSQSIRMGMGSALGSGKQMIPWVHSTDLARAFDHVIENPIEGPVNIIGGNDNNKGFMQSIAKVLKKPFWFPNVPGFILRLILGEMSVIILKGIKASNQKIIDSGFQFEFTELDEAMENLLLNFDKSQF